MKWKVWILIASLMTLVFADYVEIAPQVVNGTDAEISEFPFMASLRRNELHSCGATILNEWWLMTVKLNFLLKITIKISRNVFQAAHCIVVAPVSSFSVQFASTTVSRTGKNIIRVAELIRHEAYLPSNQYINDIGLIKVSEKIHNPLNDFTVKLPLPGSQFTTGTPALLIGWGMDETDGHYMTNLQKVDLQVYSALDCDKIHKNRVVHRTNICGGVPEGGKGQVSCVES